MAHGDQVGRPFAAENAGHLRNRQDIALFHGFLFHCPIGLFAQPDASLGHRAATGNLFPGDIHHAGIPLSVEMGKFHRVIVLSYYFRMPFRKISTPMAIRITPPRIEALPASRVPKRFPSRRPIMQMPKVTTPMMNASTQAAAAG